MAPVGRVTPADRPDYVTVDLDRPELYFGDSIGGYAITGTTCKKAAAATMELTKASRACEMSGFMRRAAFALAFLDYNVVGSGAIEPDSQMLWVRSVPGSCEQVGAVPQL